MDFAANKYFITSSNRQIFNNLLTRINKLIPGNLGLKTDLIHLCYSFFPTGKALNKL